MRKKLLLLAVGVSSLLGFSELKAQDYKLGVGLALGEEIGVSAKYFISNRSAIDGTFGWGVSCKSLMFSATYQYHIPLIENLNVYFGGGFNIGGQHVKNSAGQFAFGLDPNAGIEYKFDNAPIAVGLDYRPMINLTANTHSEWNVVGLRLRYTF